MRLVIFSVKKASLSDFHWRKVLQQLIVQINYSKMPPTRQLFSIHNKSKFHISSHYSGNNRSRKSSKFSHSTWWGGHSESYTPGILTWWSKKHRVHPHQLHKLWLWMKYSIIWTASYVSRSANHWERLLQTTMRCIF